jgi:hypothetical protein
MATLRRNVYENKCLGIYLRCSYDSFDAYREWICIAKAKMRVCSQMIGVEDFQRKITHNFTALENDWGYAEFIKCDIVLNGENGFILNDTVRIEALLELDGIANSQ